MASQRNINPCTRDSRPTACRQATISGSVPKPKGMAWRFLNTEEKSYEFRTFLKEPGRARGAPHVTSEVIAQALEAAEHQERACATLEPIYTEHDGRVRELRALVMRRGQKEFREALLDA